MTINFCRNISQYFKPYIRYLYTASHICGNLDEIYASGCKIYGYVRFDIWDNRYNNKRFFLKHYIHKKY